MPVNGVQFHFDCTREGFIRARARPHSGQWAGLAIPTSRRFIPFPKKGAISAIRSLCPESFWGEMSQSQKWGRLNMLWSKALGAWAQELPVSLEQFGAIRARSQVHLLALNKWLFSHRECAPAFLLSVSPGAARGFVEGVWTMGHRPAWTDLLRWPIIPTNSELGPVSRIVERNLDLTSGKLTWMIFLAHYRMGAAAGRIVAYRLHGTHYLFIKNLENSYRSFCRGRGLTASPKWTRISEFLRWLESPHMYSISSTGVDETWTGHPDPRPRQEAQPSPSVRHYDVGPAWRLFSFPEPWDRMLIKDRQEAIDRWDSRRTVRDGVTMMGERDTSFASRLIFDDGATIACVSVVHGLYASTGVTQDARRAFAEKIVENIFPLIVAQAPLLNVTIDRAIFRPGPGRSATPRASRAQIVDAGGSAAQEQRLIQQERLAQERLNILRSARMGPYRRRTSGDGS